MLCDLLVPLLDDGHQRVLILNGHGGNIDTMQVACGEAATALSDRILRGSLLLGSRKG
jgi:creatinine amidohydrolase/Fe(II)-dependent formamide hydrolase-like protein